MYNSDEFQASSLSIIRSMLHTHLHLHAARTRRIVWKPSNSTALSNILGTGINKTDNICMSPTLNGVRVTTLAAEKTITIYIFSESAILA
jgi:hypothetical protein